MPLTNIGRKAPRFDLIDQHGERHRLEDYRGRILVLYFYPKDDTPTCTIQACQIRDHRADFAKAGATVLGISPDDQASHAAFASRHALDFPLLADIDLDSKRRPRTCRAYGAWDEKVLFGRRYTGVIRTTYLIDEQGLVQGRWDRVKVPGHAAKVLAAVKALHGAGRKNGSAPKLRKGVRDSDPPYQPVRGTGRNGSARSQRSRPNPSATHRKPRPTLRGTRKR